MVEYELPRQTDTQAHRTIFYPLLLMSEGEQEYLLHVVCEQCTGSVIMKIPMRQKGVFMNS